MVQTRRRLPRHGHAVDSFAASAANLGERSLRDEGQRVSDFGLARFKPPQDRRLTPPPRTRRIEAWDNYTRRARLGKIRAVPLTGNEWATLLGQS